MEPQPKPRPAPCDTCVDRSCEHYLNEDGECFNNPAQEALVAALKLIKQATGGKDNGEIKIQR